MTSNKHVVDSSSLIELGEDPARERLHSCTLKPIWMEKNHGKKQVYFRPKGTDRTIVPVISPCTKNSLMCILIQHYVVNLA